MSAQLLGVVLSFATVDGRELALTVSLTEPATASLDWGGVMRRVDGGARVHSFRGLRTPTASTTPYRLEIAGLLAVEETVEPPVLAGSRLKVAVYGDNRDGAGPHGALLQRMIAADPTLIVNTGDVVHVNEDDEGWASYLSTTFPLSRRVPTILALGNHERFSRTGDFSGALTKILSYVPPVEDPLAGSLGAPRGVFHVHVGPALFVSLDSNAELGPGSPQLRFLDRALAERAPGELAFVAMHHGPLSAGPHGGHPEAAALLEILRKREVTAVLSGHDHTYQRIVDGKLVAIVTGGGGAPLYQRERPVDGLEVFSSTYHWVQLELARGSAVLSAFAIEGTPLDKARIFPDPEHAARPGASVSWAVIGGVQLLVLVALATLLFRWRRAP